MRFERAPRSTRQMAMTPLIDVVFLLLIFFMLSTSFVRTESIEINMPRFMAEMQQENLSIPIYVSKGGQLYLHHDPINEERLREALKRVLDQRPDMPILLMTGPGVSVQEMVKAMDTIYLSGGNNVSVTSWTPEKQEGTD